MKLTGCAAGGRRSSGRRPSSGRERLGNLQDVLEHRTARSVQALRDILGPIHMEVVKPDVGRL